MVIAAVVDDAGVHVEAAVGATLVDDVGVNLGAEFDAAVEADVDASAVGAAVGPNWVLVCWL